ncbi:MAG: polyphosphate polymerase domain-containing protein [Deltaproteobacteria bacterium]|nr:polyphosphate polymerase domain-containing protein [Deltaproteobacteria bacterium]
MSRGPDPEKPRYELKFVVTHEQANAVLKRIQDVMVVDPMATLSSTSTSSTLEQNAYRVRSVYADNDNLQAYFEKLDGVDPRFKLRLRMYGDEKGDGHAAFLEVKHRIGALIQKDRLPLSQHQARLCCEQGVWSASDLPAHPSSQKVRHFVLSRIQSAVCTVSYRRQAWVTRLDSGLRVTLDTNLRVAGPDAVWGATSERGLRFLPSHLAILELKFHWAAPLWLASLVREIRLVQRRYSKYCSALEALRPDIAEREVRFSKS